MSLRIVFALVVLLAGSGAGTGRVLADGVRIDRVVGVGELARTSDVVFVATINDSRPEWAEREVSGQKVRYVQHYTFQIKPTDWLKGGAGGGKGMLWLGVRGDPVPGKWEIRHEDYDVTFDPSAAKKGDSVVVFVTRESWQGWVDSAEVVPVVHARACEKADHLAAIRKALQAPAKAAPSRR
jgi:hypothetical protein